jgi:hypothetical protein
MRCVLDQRYDDVLARLQEEVLNLKHELRDTELENKALMRLRGYDLDLLTIEELNILSMELQLGLERIKDRTQALRVIEDDVSSSSDEHR